MARWADTRGTLIEFRRPRDELIRKRRHPAQTGYIAELYTNETKTNPIERQALEMLFMQKVDDRAADALAHLEMFGTKPADLALRDAWSRFLMSLMHRSPERVRRLTEKLRDYEERILNPDIAQKYDALRGKDDPEDFKDWLATEGPLTPDLRVRLLRMLIDNPRIGAALGAMHWIVYRLDGPRFGFLTGDQPILLSDGIAPPRGFVMLAVGPERLFIGAHDPKVIDAFTSQRPNALESAVNDACVRQSHHVIVADHDRHRAFIDRRFLKTTIDAGTSGHVTWRSPLIDR